MLTLDGTNSRYVRILFADRTNNSSTLITEIGNGYGNTTNTVRSRARLGGVLNHLTECHKEMKNTQTPRYRRDKLVRDKA